ncbi:MoxR family ATPase [Bradyrhizobium sp. 150]|uniref:AAA family ATPase n=1 Tax=Bradyrhizobium sp. 150 TaxID=2782625 RepID=UPI001FFA8A6A|nr:MoxR family ATPase [Bradyrhizobium sp. 150]MCK1675241.1 AAA family ATPase [Bradyrhizobium sp. 150]
MTDWRIFHGDRSPHDDILTLPHPPPWRFARAPKKLLPATSDDSPERQRAEPFRPTQEMIRAVNAALYLRRPLLLTGRPGSGKSTLISKVAHELMLGTVLRWPINSRSTVRGGIYEYDAIGRLQAGTTEPPLVESYLKLGPLGTALVAKGRPCALLVDEIDKSDLDFANDLLNIIEDGEYEIAELRRLGEETVTVSDSLGRPVEISRGLLQADHFPFVIMTSNGEREFPAPFLRRCIRLDVETPTRSQVEEIVIAQLKLSKEALAEKRVKELIDDFVNTNVASNVSTDQLLNAIFLTATLKDTERRTFSDDEFTALRATLMRQISGPVG